jgi:hypothetical protein
MTANEIEKNKDVIDVSGDNNVEEGKTERAREGDCIVYVE